VNTIVLKPVDGADRDSGRGVVPSPELREVVISAIVAALVRDIREEAARERTPNSEEAA
jgi:hypothetical protein